MELKFEYGCLCPCKTACFNRTFMELKYVIMPMFDYNKYCFNRTFMELKCGFAFTSTSLKVVLIVPLWN